MPSPRERALDRQAQTDVGLYFICRKRLAFFLAGKDVHFYFICEYSIAWREKEREGGIEGGTDGGRGERERE